MMNKRGKSDPAIVAAKPANKAEPSATEPLERRAGTKGNADQQRMGRTQSRETMSQVLARIRQTAEQDSTAVCRHTPKVGAVCGKAARTDLCGGRGEISVPTATAPCARNPGTPLQHVVRQKLWRVRPRIADAALHPGYGPCACHVPGSVFSTAAMANA